MASHHLHHAHHHHLDHHIHPTTTCNCCCFNSSPLHAQEPDPLVVQAIASQLRNLHNTRFNLNQNNQSSHSHQQAIISSLITRIEKLELSLNLSHRHKPSSLRHVAAGVIQTHFRAFLVRRSTSLRHLKTLALIKTSYNALKSNQTHLDFHLLYQKALDLLLRVDSIKGGDPMVRDGKRCLSRELARFLDCIEEESVVLVRKSSSSRSRGEMKVLKERVERMRKISKGFRDYDNVGFFGGRDYDEEVAEPIDVRRGKNAALRGQSRPKKSVSFSDVHRVYNDDEELISNEEDNCTDGSGSTDGSAEIERLRNKVERMSNLLKSVENEETRTENEERNSKMNPVTNSSKQNGKNDGELLVSAPLPLKMESRADL